MLGSIRLVRVTLTFLAFCAGLSPIVQTAYSHQRRTGQASDRTARGGQGRGFGQNGCAHFRKPASGGKHGQRSWLLRPARRRSVASVLSPLRPSTVDDRRRLEAVRLYGAARALEDQRAWSDAVVLLQDSNLIPTRSPLHVRLCRLYVGALGVRNWRCNTANGSWRSIRRIQYPGPTGRLLKKNDPAGAEALLTDVLANPKLDAHAPGRLLAEFELGKLYSGRLHQTDKAADAYAKVLEANR